MARLPLPRCGRLKLLRSAVLFSSGSLLTALSVLYLVVDPKHTWPIDVVEDNHEALAYWLSAVEQGAIPKEGNVLIHVGGRSVEGTPRHIDGMPVPRAPLDERQTLLQRSDTLVQSAVLAGLVSHFIWVWPSWDQRLMATKGSIESKTVELGYVKLSGEIEAIWQLCQCIMQIPPSTWRPRACSYVNYTGVEEMVVELPSENCIRLTSYTSEHINEHHVTSRLSQDTPLFFSATNASLIFSVSEDFFGSESVGELLSRTGLPWELLWEIDGALAPFLCPGGTSDERVGDTVLRQLLLALLGVCQRPSAKLGCANPLNDTLAAVDELLVEEYYSNPTLFCGKNDEEVRQGFARVAATFYRLSTRKLYRLLDVGFCLAGSAKTLRFSPSTGGKTRAARGASSVGELSLEQQKNRFVLCHGADPPRSQKVFRHVSKAYEIELRMRTFSDIVERCVRPAAPRVVTLARGVREGYTPRALAASIEEGVLGGLELLNTEKERYAPRYDVDLLGAEYGWASRPRIVTR